MKSSSTLDYQSYYNDIFANEKEREQQKKLNFLNFLSEVILKYSDIFEDTKTSLEEKNHD